MKKILGLDLGTTSIGWAFVHEAENETEESKIIRLGVRVNPLSTDEQQDFEKGKSITINADRTQKRSARRNLQRYKQRRSYLLNILLKNNIINSNTVLAETGEDSTFETLKLRAKAASGRVELEEFARVLFSINKKRGYKSSRKAKNEEEGETIDGMEVALNLYDNKLTPGQYCYNMLEGGKTILPDFYRSDLRIEFDKVWKLQKQYHPELLTDDLYKGLEGKGSKATWAICKEPFGIVGVKRVGNKREQKKENYKWRSEAIEQQIGLEQLAIVLQDINNNLNNSSGYLGAISDRSKELYFNKETVGQNLYKQIQVNPNIRLKGQVFYRQDYLDEFDKIWEIQQKYHSQLNEELRKEIRDIIIFYQRRLKSQKGLIGFCEFESKEIKVTIDGKPKTKIIGPRVCPKSSPLFQEFKIWQNLSNLEIKNIRTKEVTRFVNYEDEVRNNLFNTLNIRGKLKKVAVLKILNLDKNIYDLNYSELQGNTTNEALYKAYEQILTLEGYENINLTEMPVSKAFDSVSSIFKDLGIDTSILNFDTTLKEKEFEKQKSYALWHLLYSYEGDKSKTGNDALYKKLKKDFGFKKEHAQYLIKATFQTDYGNLSTKAIRKIYPYIKDNNYSDACAKVDYNHSHSLTKEENASRVLKDRLDPVVKNSLRNPVVEKILNQMVNVINTIIDDENLGKPDEVRIELARELKKSAKERAEMTSNISKAKGNHEKYKEILRNEFGVKYPTRNDLIRYKLYMELESSGYKTLYTNTYIPQEKLFSKEFDIEHIIPKARLYDDSFSNKTLEARQANVDKGDQTAYDYIETNRGVNDLKKYKERIEKMYKDGHISKAKYQKLLMKGSEIGEGFIERDLRESQYIAKKAKQMLLELCENVVSTSGSITDRLRDDWGLINIMKELNIDKYRKLGLTKIEERRSGQKVEKIIDWTKRNDHRHHAMDALTVAFTKHSHIQYLNNLNARKEEYGKYDKSIFGIEVKETEFVNNKRKFKLPMPQFRMEAEVQLQRVLISHKAKNKVVTRNFNKSNRNGTAQSTLTPRGRLHKETVYGKMQNYETTLVKVGTKFDFEMADKVAIKLHRDAIVNRLKEYDGNAKKAFGGKNSPTKNPIIDIKGNELPYKIKLVSLVDKYTIRKEITPDLKIDKVIDEGIKRILQERLKAYNNKPKEAFSNLENNPIWLNKEKGISIKRVTISGVNNVETLHYKKDNLGNIILDENGKKQAADFVSTGNNHHVAIYKDEKGNLQEEVVSLFEAVARVNAGIPIINKNHDKGWEFLFTMKRNEMFVFPSDDFDLTEIDLTNPENYNLISPHLFRVQKIASKNYYFRHHLETDVEEKEELKGYTYISVRSPNNLNEIIKVRIDHIGQIVYEGECEKEYFKLTTC